MAKQWSSKSLGSRFQHAIFYKALAWVGWPLAYFFLFFVVFWYALAPTARKRSLPYLQRRFPKAGKVALWLHTLRLYLEFGKVLVDRAQAGINGNFVAKGSPQDEQGLVELVQEGKGLILLSAHVGSWQMALSALGVFQGHTVHVVMHKDNQDNDKHYFEHNRTKAPFARIDPASGLEGSLQMLDALQQQQVLAFLGDRVFGDSKNVIRIPFMGGTIAVPLAPYALAATTGAPVAIFFAHRTGVGKSIPYLAGVIRIPSSVSSKSTQQLLPYATVYGTALEEFAIRYPYQFFNFYDMWEPCT